MLKKICVLGCLAAAALGCVLTPSAQANQVEVNQQTASQNAAAVGTGNAVIQNLDQSSYQTQFQVPNSGYYYSQPGKPQLQISNQAAQQNGASVGIGNAVIQDLNQINWQNQSNFN